MRRFIEKSIIISFCLFNTYITIPDANLSLYFLIGAIFSLFLDLIHHKNIRFLISLLFIYLCVYDRALILYLPLILYNLYLDFKPYILLTIPLLYMDFSLLVLLISIASVYMSRTSHRYQLFIYENRIIRDELKEDTIILKKYNEQLRIDREKNIQIAILTERNRIARELHDSIGHSLSSSILQIEALKISSDPSIEEGLNQIQKTLDNGMDDIRNSIHNLYRDSFDLRSKIENLLNEVHTIETNLIYKMEEDLPYDLKFDIISIVKEGITNCVKHSNGSELKISLLSQPKFYTIAIKDNGTNYQEPLVNSNDGIGLLSMDEIASKYHGFLNYGYDNGFKIHIILMKG